MPLSGTREPGIANACTTAMTCLDSVQIPVICLWLHDIILYHQQQQDKRDPTVHDFYYASYDNVAYAMDLCLYLSVCLSQVGDEDQLKRAGLSSSHLLHFYRASYALAVYAMVVCLCVCPSVCLCVSVTSRSSTKMAKHRKTQTTPYDSPGTLVFWCQKSFRNSTGVTPNGGAKCRWGRVKSANFDK